MLHPSRAVSLAYLCLGVLLAVWGAVSVGESTLGGAMVLVGGIVLLVSSLYGLVRYEINPIVTEYGLQTYALLAGAAIFALGVVVQLIVT
ncbi:hypothetical protein [Halorhabdus rudnickae]|uniref:hypothetical protein n=1 Tax=Halorhabdus rudnickae TaxID=1775544 RepID=UPI001082CCB5|nr:hypothetical protein [Halorhabdus rudnickae]